MGTGIIAHVRHRTVAWARQLFAGTVLAGIAACAAIPPADVDNVCRIFEQRGDWYQAAQRAQARWGMPIPVQMAIIHRESRYIDDARPPRRHLLGIPLWRGTSAYGYAQVTDETWEWYRNESGNRWADRDEFEDGVDFISWYGEQARKRLGVSEWDAYRQYLAYHEGLGGFERGSYRGKAWLTKAARAVEAQAKVYAAQLATCKDELNRPWYWPF